MFFINSVSVVSNGKTSIISNRNNTISNLIFVLVEIKKKETKGTKKKDYIYYLRTTRSKHETEIYKAVGKSNFIKGSRKVLRARV